MGIQNYIENQDNEEQGNEEQGNVELDNEQSDVELDNEDLNIEDYPNEEKEEQSDEEPENIKYIVGENGLLEDESDDELVDRDKLIALQDQYNDNELIERVLGFNKYTNIQIDDYLDYVREISHIHFSYEERNIIPTLYSKFKKRNTNQILHQLFKLIKLIQDKERKKIASYLLFYVVSITLKTINIRDAISLYIVGYEKMLEFKEHESLNFEDFFKFDHRELPKIEEVLNNRQK